MKHADIVVIGTGPGGVKAAIQAAKLGKRVIVIERNTYLGGTGINTGTIPSKALREAILDLTGARFRHSLSGYTPKPDLSIRDLIAYCFHIIQAEREVIHADLYENDVELLWGDARFENANTLLIRNQDDETTVTADVVIIATGTAPARPESIPFDDQRIVDSDSLLNLSSLPKSIIVVGGGVIGTEYACMLNRLGIQTTLVETRDRLLDFIDSEIIEALQYQMRSSGITLRMGEKVSDISIQPDGSVHANLQSGKHLRAETLLYCIGRNGATKDLDLEKINLKADDRGRLKVNERFQTEIPNVYAIGDVIGFPALASTSMEQGRVAAIYAAGETCDSISQLLPYGIFAIPELSMVGKTEAQLTKEGVPYECGIAHYKQTARGQLLGDEVGMLKILFHEENRCVLGVHAIGTGATELIHIGQTAIAFNATLDYFIDAVFNYPTLAECYKLAALNGAERVKRNQSSTNE